MGAASAGIAVWEGCVVAGLESVWPGLLVCLCGKTHAFCACQHASAQALRCCLVPIGSCGETILASTPPDVLISHGVHMDIVLGPQEAGAACPVFSSAPDSLRHAHPSSDPQPCSAAAPPHPHTLYPEPYTELPQACSAVVLPQTLHAELWILGRA